MAWSPRGMLGTVTRRRRVRFIDNLWALVRGLPPSDRFIAAVLALAFIVSCAVGLIALERTILVEVPARGGSFTEGVVGSPRFVNPLLALTDADRDMVALTYAGLMGPGPDGLRGVLAESFTISPDGKIYTFVLREGIKFTDGTPITSDDVVFTIQKAQDPTLKSPELANWANIRAEAVDARTVRFTLPKAYAAFLDDTTLGILPAHVWKGIPNQEFPFSPYMERPVAEGPFKVARVLHDSEGKVTGYDLVANPSYALRRPYLDAIRLRFFASNDQLLGAYRNHSIESAYGIPVKGARTAPYSRVFGVFFNASENKALENLAVRKALSIAIDRDRIVRDLLGGYASPLMGPVPPGSGINGPLIPEGDRVALATEILEAGGWTYDEVAGTWTNAKAKLTLDPIAITTSNVPELKTLASAIEADWEAIRVPTSLELDDPSTLTASVIRPRAYQALFFGMVVGRGQDLFPFWASSQKNDPGLNIALYGDKEVDALLEQARRENDPAVRKGQLQRISDAIAADYPAAFTHAPQFVYALPWNIEGVTLPQITSPSDRFATVADWHVETEWVWPVFANK
jgi:peptide/nickel transport system substrate-binding protein